LLTTIFWYRTPIAIIALMILCGGDGMADLVGIKFGKRHLPWSPNKTFIGSLAVFMGGGALALILILIFTSTGNLPGPFAAYLLPVGIIALAAMLIESLPIADVDNFTVPLASALLGILLF
jgi:phytol kinase